jgi:hypothetical protein
MPQLRLLSWTNPTAVLGFPLETGAMMTRKRCQGLTLLDRRWITLAGGILAFWLQLVAPFAMTGSMPSTASGFDGLASICQLTGSGAGKSLPSDPHGKIRDICQICITLHQLAAGAAVPGAAPMIAALPQAGQESRERAQTHRRFVLASFSSRAPPRA